MNGSHTGGSNYNIGTGTTLAGAGTISLGSNAAADILGSVEVGNSALTPPAAAILSLGTSGSGATTFHGGSILSLELFSGAGLGDQTGDPTSADLFALTGDLILNGTVTLEVLNPNTMTAWAAGDRWKLFDWTGLGTQTGLFDLSLPDLSSTSLLWDTSDLYTGGTLAIAIPEPSRIAFLGLAFIGLILRRRR